jgi:16S rRNA A1518/A1519 N6-dimethyltransferase RsmA/KsgA/DIM1 with predicted DNA glycosylase/AP lyase activity
MLLLLLLLPQVPNLQLVHGDVMRLDLQALIAQMAEAAAAAAAAQQDSSSQHSSSDPQQQQRQLQQAFQEALQQPAAAGSSSGSRSSSGAAPARQRRRGVKVVANLPYNITKEFLQAMLPQGGVVSELSIMIQVWHRLVSAAAAAVAAGSKQ